MDDYLGEGELPLNFDSIWLYLVTNDFHPVMYFFSKIRVDSTKDRTICSYTQKEEERRKKNSTRCIYVYVHG